MIHLYRNTRRIVVNKMIFTTYWRNHYGSNDETLAVIVVRH